MSDHQAIDRELQRHYSHGALAAAIDRSLVKLGKDPAALTVDDLALVDELHLGGRPASLALFDQCGFAKGMHLLDVGSGLGGPARACAFAKGANVTGVDLTPEFVEVARNLSQRVGLASATTFRQGSVLDLPFADGTFDGAYMIHVGMNINDKPRLFGQVRRVVRPGAIFGVYDVMRLSDGPLQFPVPWSSHADTSFVETPENYRGNLVAAGFEIVAERNRLAAALDFVAKIASRTQAGSAPVLDHRGPDWKRKFDNLLAMLQQGLVGPVEIVAKAV